MKKLLLFSFCLIMWNLGFSQRPGASQDGFQISSTGLKYKFFKDTDGPAAKISDYVTIDLIYRIHDSIIFDSHENQSPFVAPISESTYSGDLYEGLQMMSLGDSAVFALNADSFYLKTIRANELPSFIKKGSAIMVFVKMKNIQTKVEYNQSIADANFEYMLTVESDTLTLSMSDFLNYCTPYPYTRLLVNNDVDEAIRRNSLTLYLFADFIDKASDKDLQSVVFDYFNRKKNYQSELQKATYFDSQTYVNDKNKYLLDNKKARERYYIIDAIDKDHKGEWYKGYDMEKKGFQITLSNYKTSANDIVSIDDYNMPRVINRIFISEKVPMEAKFHTETALNPNTLSRYEIKVGSNFFYFPMPASKAIELDNILISGSGKVRCIFLFKSDGVGGMEIQGGVNSKIVQSSKNVRFVCYNTETGKVYFTKLYK